MKIRFISLVLTFYLVQCLASLGFAQGNSDNSVSSNDSKLGYGIKTGANMSILTNHKGTSFSTLGYGFSAGVFTSYKLIDFVSVIGEVSYTEQNYLKIDESIIFNTNGPMFSSEYIDETNTHLNFKNIEGVIKINITPFSSNKFNPSIFVGYSAAYMFNVNANIERTYNRNSNSTLPSNTTNGYYDISNRFKYFNHSIIMGIGSEIELGGSTIKALTIELDYKYGLNNINNISFLKEFSTNSFDLIIGVKF